MIISARTLVTAFCLGLSLVFVGATSASIVDRVQHGAQIEHGHEGPMLLSTATVSHDADHHAPDGDDDDADDAGGSLGHQPASGHHHADAPAGVLGSVVAAAGSLARSVAGVSLGNPGAARGVTPGGLERPPKRIMQTV